MANKLTVLALGFCLFILPRAAMAVAIMPGDACTTANQTVLSGGIDTSGAQYLLKCSGSKWVQVLKVDAAGNVSAPGALTPGYDTTACSATINGEIRYNSASPAFTYCNGSAWVPFSSAGSSCPVIQAGTNANLYGTESVWHDGTYAYIVTDVPDLEAVSWSGAANAGTPVVAPSLTAPDYVYGDANYIYVTDIVSGTYYLRAFTFSGTAFTLKGSISIGTATAYNIWTNGGYIYVADGTGGLKAFSFNGSTFTSLATLAATTNYAVTYVSGDGTTLYFTENYNANSKVRAATFNGTAFTAGGSYNSTSKAGYTGAIYANGTYIFVAGRGIFALTYSGGTFTYKASAAAGAGPDRWIGSLVGSGNYIYVSYSANVAYAYSFNGSAFIFKGLLPTLGQYWGSYYIKNGYLFMTAGTGGDTTAVPLCQ